MRVPSFLLLVPVGKQSQLLLKPTKDELGLQVGVEFDNKGYSKMQGTKIQDTKIQGTKIQGTKIHGIKKEAKGDWV